MNDLYYLATPYTLYPTGRDAAYRMACRESAVLIKAGLVIYSPIAHSHPISIYGGVDPLDWQLWMRQCRAMLPRVSGLIALKASSWETSLGMQEEIRIMRELGKPVIMMRLGEVPKELAG